MNKIQENERQEDSFTLRSYRKQELAMLYFPDVTKEAASKNLRRWITQCSALYQELISIGYDKYRKYYLRNEVRLIVRYLGEP